MKIKEITYKSGRDYWAIFICENCGHEEKDRGYDDDNYRENVIPNIRCHICDKSTNDLRQSMDVREFFRLGKKYCEAHECALCDIEDYCRSIFDGQSVLTITIGSDTLDKTIATLREWEASHE